MRLYALLLLLPAFATACSPLYCPDAKGDPNLCAVNEYSDDLPDSAWRVLIINSSRSGTSASSCIIEQTYESKTTQEFLDVEILEVVYSAVDNLQPSPGERVRLDFGAWTLFNCTGPSENRPSICFNSCGPVESDIFDAFPFMEGVEYVIFLNERAEYKKISPSMAPTSSGETTNARDVCGKDSRFSVANGEACDNIIAKPTPDQMEQLKEACGETIETPALAPDDASTTEEAEVPLSGGTGSQAPQQGRANNGPDTVEGIEVSSVGHYFNGFSAFCVIPFLTAQLLLALQA